MVTKVAKWTANLVAKNDAKISPSSHSIAIITFSFGEKERPAQIKLIYSVNGESVEGKRFSEAVLQVNSASEKERPALRRSN
ncbi:hypothetical protein TNCV_3646221 [Trichonephila clavipes]|nr:hypothetical protein TNCV_3646221 [Trichonephila clavipes]